MARTRRKPPADPALSTLERVEGDAAALSQLGAPMLPAEVFEAEDDPFNDAPDNVTYDVYRLDEVKKKPVYQFRLERAEVEMGLSQVIQDKRGGGTYDVREKYPDPTTGRPKWGRSKRIYVDGPPKALIAPKVEVGTVPQGGYPTGAPAQAGSVDELLQQRVFKMVEMQDAVTAGIIERFKTGGDGTPAWLTSLLPLLTPVLVAAVERLMTPAAPAPVIAPQPPAQMSELLATLRELRDFNGEGGSREERDDSPLGAVREFAPILRDIFAQARREDESRATPRRALSAGGGAPMNVLTLLAARVPQLVKLASEGKNAVAYGQVVADNIPAVLKPQLVAFLSRPVEVWGNEWFKQFPVCRPHAKWFVDFGISLRDAIGAAPLADDAPLPVNGDIEPDVHAGEELPEVEPPEGGAL